jgi:RimJ/RimL family protein N-acetyltransferase
MVRYIARIQGQGFAKQAFEFWLAASKKMGLKTARLYTDLIENADAIKFYHRIGMTMEKYYTKEDVHSFMDTTVIFSKSLTNKPVELWNNKNIFLHQQELKEKLFSK